MAKTTGKPKASPIPPTSIWLDAAVAIGEQLMEDACDGKRHASWQGDELVGESIATARVVRADVGSSLYSGTAGIGWFLTQLGSYTGHAALLHCGVYALINALEDALDELDASNMSLFSGASGIALAGVQAGARVGEQRLTRSAHALGRAVARQMQKGCLPEETDLISGTAGIAVALAGMHRVTPEQSLVDGCIAACRHVSQQWRKCASGNLELRIPESAGISHLCGLAHGASGLAWALQEGAVLEEKTGFLDVAAEVLDYERSWFDAVRSNWPDLRNPPSEANHGVWPTYMAGWCHGAVGIGALRWHMYEKSNDAATLAEASASIYAARTVAAAARHALMRKEFSDVTLCHGLGGIVELLLLAFEATGLGEHYRAAHSVGHLCLDIYQHNHSNWTTGVAGANYVPGLMTGLAGIGSMMLRLHDCSAIPSPLLPGRVRLHHDASNNAYGLINGPVEAHASGSA